MSNKTFAQLSVGTKAYLVIVAAAGAVTVAESVYALFANDTAWKWMFLAALTLLSGSATVKLPSLPATISVSETFVFTAVLLFGTPAGTLTVALDAFVISLWSYRKGHPLYKIVFNLFALPLTIWIASQLFFAIANIEPLFGKNVPVDGTQLLLPLLVLAIVYFSLNSWIITFAIALEKGLPPFKIWREHFAWLSLNYFGGASVAALLVRYTQSIDFSYLLILPLLVILYLTFSAAMGRVEDANKHLAELNNLYMSTIETLAMAIDAKDQITHGHIRRVQTFTIGLARKLGVTDPHLLKAVEAAALLHDMGKLAVPEYILNKPGPLTPAEFEKMKLHASVGADILSAIEFPYPVVPIVRHHHENWNGTGYPDGLAGAAIPIGARILAVVDCFDALTSDRPYRPRLPDREAIRILLERRGTMYDPLVVDTFLRVYREIAPEPSIASPTSHLRAIAEASVGHISLSAPSRRLEEIAASTEEMLTLFDLARGLNNHMSVQDAGDVIAKHLRRLIPCSLCIFYLYEIDSDTLFACHAVGDNATVVGGLRMGVGERLTGWVAANRRSIRNSDPVLDFGDAARAMHVRLRSCLSAPMISDSNLVGVVSLYAASQESFSEEHQRILEVVAKQVASIVYHAWEFEKTKALSLRDHVTGLPNLEHLRRLTRGQIGGYEIREPACLLLIDVNDLEAINRQFGRNHGDEILARVVRASRRSLRAADFLFRYRDDEFIALLLQTDRRTGLAIARRIEEAVIEDSRDDVAAPFQVSVAVVASPDDGATVEELIDAAADRLERTRQSPGRTSSTPSDSGSIH